MAKTNTKKRLPAGYKERSDGRIEARFAIDGKRYSVYGASVQECKKKEIELRKQIEAGLYTDNRTITLDAYYKEWKSRRSGTVKKSTEYRRDGQFKNISKELGKRKIASLETREIVALQKKLSESLTTTGVNQTIDLLRGILESARIDRITAWNPCDGIKSLQRKEAPASETIHRALSNREVEIFFRYAEGSWYYEFFALLLQTGLRGGEASALTWKDIDFAKNVIHVSKTVIRTADNHFEISTPKTKSSKRSVPMTKAAKDILLQQKRKYEELYGGKVLPIDSRIFTMTDGSGYVVTQNTSTVVKSIVKKAIRNGEKIEVFAPHAFRATFATRAIEAGMSPQTLKTILGHSSYKMTMDLYSHVADKTKQAEIKKLDIAY